MDGHGCGPAKLLFTEQAEGRRGLRQLCSWLTPILKAGPLDFIAQKGTQFLFLALSLLPTPCARILIKGQNVLAQAFFAPLVF